MFNRLMALSQRYIGLAIDGEMDTTEALDALAEATEETLREKDLLE